MERNDDWYRARILHRHRRTEGSQARIIDPLSEADVEVLSQLRVSTADVDQVRPVLLLGDSRASWTLFGTRGVITFHRGTHRRLRFADGWQKIKPVGIGQLTKVNVECITVGGVELWAPPGAELYNLWGLLLSVERSGQFGPEAEPFTN